MLITVFVTANLLFTKAYGIENVLHSSDEDLAEETQRAVCRIDTAEIQTSANATVTRKLKGICTTRLIERKFRQLEQKIISELAIIKTLLTHSNSPPIVVKNADNDYNYEENFKSFDNIETDEDIVTVTEMVLSESSWIRTEIYQLNNTVYTLKGQQVYAYYWAVPKIRQFFLLNDARIKSSEFYVLGQQFNLQLYANYQEFSYLGVELQSTQKYPNKHKLTILEQMDPSKDINSQTFLSKCVYKIPYAKLEERHYLRNDTILIKVTVYLDQ